MDAATLTYDTLRFEYEDFPETKDPVWILGRTYSVFTGLSCPVGRIFDWPSCNSPLLLSSQALSSVKVIKGWDLGRVDAFLRDVTYVCLFVSENPSEKEEILLDVTSRFWFTYRKNFPAIGK
ncbi:unnamed protein product [Caretta caretta]